MPGTVFFANNLIDHIIGHAAYPAPTPLFLGLFSTAVSPSGVGTELLGNGYLRIETSSLHWSVASSGQIRNLQQFTFGPATATWPKIFALGVIDSGNNVLMWHPINNSPFSLLEGQSLVFNANEIILSLG